MPCSWTTRRAQATASLFVSTEAGASMATLFRQFMAQVLLSVSVSLSTTRTSARGTPMGSFGMLAPACFPNMKRPTDRMASKLQRRK